MKHLKNITEDFQSKFGGFTKEWFEKIREEGTAKDIQVFSEVYMYGSGNQEGSMPSWNSLDMNDFYGDPEYIGDNSIFGFGQDGESSEINYPSISLVSVDGKEFGPKDV